MVRVFRKEVDDTLHGLVGIVGVQRGQAQVPGFGKRDGLLHGVAVADLTVHVHVWRLAQRVFKRVFVRVRVDAHVALVHHRALVRMQELQRIFDGEDVAGDVLVAVVDHRRQRGGLA